MIISRFEIKKLYGKYDYDISFNEDITLIYGMNGCGKTTILNIVTAIITGSVYKLFSYNFKELTLYYMDNTNDKSNISEIIVKKVDGVLVVSFNGEQYIIEEHSVPDERRRRRSFDYIYDYYADLYPVLFEIKHEFNYVYLALNRATQLSEENEDYMFRSKYYFNSDGIVEPDYVAPEIRFVESLIMKKYMDVSADVNKINNEFRNRVLKKSTNLNTYKSDDEILTYISKFNTNVNKISASYIHTLEEFGLVNEKEKKQYQEFFNNCLENKRKSDEPDSNNRLSYILQCYELTRIQEIVKNAADAEERKSEVHKPINLFIETVNEFISHSDIEKRIDVDDNGRIYFQTEDDDSKFSIQFLSSGEKQLIVFFANLIFGVKSEKTGIFVVDEPELSLHLSWQRVFIRKALEVNNNVQFVFATHAPEIVRDYRDKMKKLERKRAQ